jgi:hypothetical protein
MQQKWRYTIMHTKIIVEWFPNHGPYLDVFELPSRKELTSLASRWSVCRQLPVFFLAYTRLPGPPSHEDFSWKIWLLWQDKK